MENGQELQQATDGPYYGVAKGPQPDKRKGPDDGPDGGSQGRAKRNRYISIAWCVPLHSPLKRYKQLTIRLTQ